MMILYNVFGGSWQSEVFGLLFVVKSEDEVSYVSWRCIFVFRTSWKHKCSLFYFVQFDNVLLIILTYVYGAVV